MTLSLLILAIKHIKSFKNTISPLKEQIIKNITFLLSGSGTTLDNLCKHCYESDGLLFGKAEIHKVISSRENVKGLEIAKKWGAMTYVVKPYKNYDKWMQNIYEIMSFPPRPHIIVMGGFLSLFKVRADYKGRVLNIHPSLLPKYGGKGMYGQKVYQAVLDNQEKVSGCTVHIVDEDYDTGRILAQQQVQVEENDTVESLQTKVQTVENILYPKVIADYLESLCYRKE